MLFLKKEKKEEKIDKKGYRKLDHLGQRRAIIDAVQACLDSPEDVSLMNYLRHILAIDIDVNGCSDDTLTLPQKVYCLEACSKGVNGLDNPRALAAINSRDPDKKGLAKRGSSPVALALRGMSPKILNVLFFAGALVYSMDLCDEDHNAIVLVLQAWKEKGYSTELNDRVVECLATVMSYALDGQIPEYQITYALDRYLPDNWPETKGQSWWKIIILEAKKIQKRREEVFIQQGAIEIDEGEAFNKILEGITTRNPTLIILWGGGIKDSEKIKELFYLIMQTGDCHLLNAFLVKFRKQLPYQTHFIDGRRLIPITDSTIGTTWFTSNSDLFKKNEIVDLHKKLLPYCETNPLTLAQIKQLHVLVQKKLLSQPGFRLARSCADLFYKYTYAQLCIMKDSTLALSIGSSLDDHCSPYQFILALRSKKKGKIKSEQVSFIETLINKKLLRHPYLILDAFLTLCCDQSDDSNISEFFKLLEISGFNPNEPYIAFHGYTLFEFIFMQAKLQDIYKENKKLLQKLAAYSQKHPATCCSIAVGEKMQENGTINMVQVSNSAESKDEEKQEEKFDSYNRKRNKKQQKNPSRKVVTLETILQKVQCNDATGLQEVLEQYLGMLQGKAGDQKRHDIQTWCSYYSAEVNSPDYKKYEQYQEELYVLNSRKTSMGKTLLEIAFQPNIKPKILAILTNYGICSPDPFGTGMGHSKHSVIKELINVYGNQYSGKIPGNKKLEFIEKFEMLSLITIQDFLNPNMDEGYRLYVSLKDTTQSELQQNPIDFMVDYFYEDIRKLLYSEGNLEESSIKENIKTWVVNAIKKYEKLGDRNQDITVNPYIKQYLNWILTPFNKQHHLVNRLVQRGDRVKNYLVPGKNNQNKLSKTSLKSTKNTSPKKPSTQIVQTDNKHADTHTLITTLTKPSHDGADDVKIGNQNLLTNNQKKILSRETYPKIKITLLVGGLVFLFAEIGVSLAYGFGGKLGGFFARFGLKSFTWAAYAMNVLPLFLVAPALCLVAYIGVKAKESGCFEQAKKTLVGAIILGLLVETGVIALTIVNHYQSFLPLSTSFGIGMCLLCPVLIATLTIITCYSQKTHGAEVMKNITQDGLLGGKNHKNKQKILPNYSMTNNRVAVFQNKTSNTR